MALSLLLFVALAVFVLKGSLWSVLDWPPFLFLLTFVVAGGLLGVIADFFFAKVSNWLAARMQVVEHSELAGHFLGVIGVLYAVVLALVVVTAWQQFDHAKEISMAEQQNVSNLFEVVGAYGENRADRQTAHDIQVLLLDYAVNMTREWDEMEQRKQLCLDNSVTSQNNQACQPSNFTFLPASAINNKTAHSIGEKVATLSPRTPRDQVIYEQSIALTGNFDENRVHRRHHYEDTALQGILWQSIIVGALILIGATYLITPQNPKSQRLRTVTLGAMIGMMFALAVAFDFPFTGTTGTDQSGWCTMIDHFNRAH